MLHNLCSQNLAKQLRESSSLPLWGADQLRRGHSHYPGHPGRLHGHITGAHLRHSQRRLGVGGLKDNWVKGKQEAHLVRPEPNIPSYHFSSQIWPALPTKHYPVLAHPVAPAAVSYQSPGTHLPSAVDSDVPHPQHLHWRHAANSHKGKQNGALLSSSHIPCWHTPCNRHTN